MKNIVKRKTNNATKLPFATFSSKAENDEHYFFLIYIFLYIYRVTAYFLLFTSINIFPVLGLLVYIPSFTMLLVLIY